MSIPILTEIFYWVLNISIIGSLMGLIVLVLRKIRFLPKLAVYMLWAIPLIRFWLPFGPANEFSLLNYISKFATKTVVVWQSVTNRVPFITTTNCYMAVTSYFPLVFKTDLLESIYATAAIIWAIITCAAIITAVFMYFITKSELRDAVHIRDNIYKSEKITAPAVYGIFRPKIIIPAAIAEGDIEYIIAHESVHIRRGDNLIRVIAIITACVHWFNPLSWVFLRCCMTDMELACDAAVLKGLKTDGRKEYASAILSCAAGKAFFVSAFGGAKTKVRIENILSYKKLTVFSSIAFSLLFIAVAIVLITNATV